MNAATPSSLTGVWQGTVGKAEVRVCLQDVDDHVGGAYYYTRYLRLIPLQAPAKPVAGAPSATLNEWASSGGKRNEAAWTLRPGLNGDLLEGSWEDGARKLPVQLKRVPPPAHPTPEDEAPQAACESDSFNSPREVGAVVKSSSARVRGSGTQYRALKLDFGQRFPSEIDSFELLRDDANARRFNLAQRQALIAEQGDVFACTRSVISRFGQDGDYNTSATPIFIGRKWLVIEQSGGDDCGGAHPNAHTMYQIWHLDEGRAVDAWAWFNPKGAVVQSRGQGEARYTNVEIGKALQSALVKAWPRTDEECENIVEEAASSWTLYPTEKGMTFMPLLPHVAYACTDDVTLPWSQVMPWLNAEGRRAVAEIRADMARPPSR